MKTTWNANDYRRALERIPPWERAWQYDQIRKEREEERRRRDAAKADKEAKKDPINPSHYRVEGIPEAIEIMRGLMTDSQLEGFLWGNILKYAYRYGRKGDKKETAGKIVWYAERLAELWGKEKSKEKKS